MLDLKRFRKVKNIQQKDIVKLLGVSQAYVSDIERGLKPISKDAYNILYNTYGDELKQFETEDMVQESTTQYGLKAKIQELEQQVKHLEIRLKDKDDLLNAKNDLIMELQDRMEEYKKHFDETFVNFQQEVKKYISAK
jgi:transcriptional regulator with XRE-family HTH domain